jgi:hypothetical protein
MRNGIFSHMLTELAMWDWVYAFFNITYQLNHCHTMQFVNYADSHLNKKKRIRLFDTGVNILISVTSSTTRKGTFSLVLHKQCMTITQLATGTCAGMPNQVLLSSFMLSVL